MINVKKFLKETPHFSVCLMLNETIVINIPPPNNFNSPCKILENVEIKSPHYNRGGGWGHRNHGIIMWSPSGTQWGLSWTQWDSMVISKGQVRVTGPHWS